MNTIPEEFRDWPEAARWEEARAEFSAAAQAVADAVQASAGKPTPALIEAGHRLRAAQEKFQRAQRDFDKATGEPRPAGLTAKVQEIVCRDFPPEQHPVVLDLLDRECGRNLPFHRESDAQELETVQLCVLMLSRGDLAALQKHIGMAQADCRDILLAARQMGQRQE